MSKVLSVDMRVRVLAAVSDGATHGENVRPGLSVVIGTPVKPKRMRGALIKWLSDHRDETLFEFRDTFSVQDILISKTVLHRFPVLHVQTRKKTGHAIDLCASIFFTQKPL